MMKQARNLTHNFADGARDFAERAACATSDAAKAIGPKRGFIGLAVIAAAVGGFFFTRRYLRNRSETIAAEGDQGFAMADKQTRQNGKVRNASPLAHAH